MVYSKIFYVKRNGVEVSCRWGNRIAYFRKVMGLTQSDLADMIGVFKNTISKYESCECQPSILNITLLSRALRCPFYELFCVVIFEK